MPKYTQQVKYSKLKVNPTNFRHAPVNSEVEAIKQNIDENPNTFIILLKSIIEEPRTIVFLLQEDGEEFKLMDGNRRLSVFKMFEDKHLIPTESSYDEIREIITENNISIPDTFICDIYEKNITDEELLLKRLEELHVHTDTSKSKWNPLARYRASLEMNKIKNPWMKTLLYYFDDEEYIVQITEGKTDIFQRFLNRKTQLRINESGSLDLPNDKLIVNRIVQLVKESYYTFYSDPLKTIVTDTRTTSEEARDVIQDIIIHFSPEGVENELDKSGNGENSKSIGKKPNDDNGSDIKNKRTDTKSENSTNHEGSKKKITSGKRAKRTTPEYLLDKLFISTDSEIEGDYKTGIEYILNELKELNKSKKYSSLHLSTYYLVRSLLEQTLNFWIEKYHTNIYKKATANNGQVKLGKLIDEILKNINNKSVVVFSSEIDKLFLLLFNQKTYKDRLNNMVHEPYLLNHDLNTLHTYTKAPLHSIFKFLLTEKYTGQ